MATTRQQILNDPEFGDLMMMGACVISRNIARQILQEPLKFRSNFTVLAASRFDPDVPVLWEVKTEAERRNDTEFLAAQIFNEAANIVGLPVSNVV